MKTAIVTGGTKGIGLSIVESLLDRGYQVFTNFSSDEVQAAKVRAALAKYANHLHIIKANQADRPQMQAFTDLILSKTDAINCIVCNAGATIRKPTFEITDDEWKRIFDISVNSHFYMIRDLHSNIAPDSRIIFIGSMMGVYPHGTSLPYGVTKSAIHALAKNLVKDFAGTGTTVNAIAPGFVETEWQKNKPQQIRDNINAKTACGRFATTDEISSAINFCIDNAFVNGSIIEVSGGYCYK